MTPGVLYLCKPTTANGDDAMDVATNITFPGQTPRPDRAEAREACSKL